MSKIACKESARLSNQYNSVSCPKKPRTQEALENLKPKPSNRRVTLRLSEEESQRLDRLSAGLTVSAYIRKCIFGEKPHAENTEAISQYKTKCR